MAALICAAGSGSRAGEGLPKQYRLLDGRPILSASLDLFLNHPAVSLVATVIGADHRALYDAAAAPFAASETLLAPAIGGDSRQASVRAGLEALAEREIDIVLVHDAARPFASAALVDRAIASAFANGGAVPGVAVVDTICEVDRGGGRGATLDRERCRALQTPQAFDYALLRAAHAQAEGAGRADFTDDGALYAWAGHRVVVFEGETENVKLTTPEQFEVFARREAVETLLTLGDVRMGTGFDVHAFGPGDHVILGGVAVPHDFGLSGHSDADVVLHALTDAVLGALGDGDIGAHFPPSDPTWKGADSAKFMADAVARVRARGGVIAHLDVTVIGEAPKVGPHREAMRARIAEICGVALSRVGVKATTTEKLGFAGRREGLAAMASATIRLPLTEDLA
ncbi:bifunctional enzyme IspD/IspF [Methylopila jiangsuensis]|uniref:Bifunctional enzyme IspD/IspF n=1 Tax=Methylopila jiangsuensis TaxID=586230 RepID=A0A9W6N2R7_9HYPH|nr:2-C-methyl-D-erythritol 4-phosphate cytidylyltransferase/2-C-methyl-D-erythritol 2,4-cyclodiphosphate synthase [Methylopila jiangsuensis]GLK75565.1 bifunctional enzyme IspD/IspF [Methylopila jiangsuensis]